MSVVCSVRHAVDQKPAAPTPRHVDRIGELMEADDDDDENEMTSDSCRRSLDKHQQHNEHDVVGRRPPCDDDASAAASPPADAGTSCERPDAAIGCHGDDDESVKLQRQTDVDESLPTQQHQQQATGPPRHRLTNSSLSVSIPAAISACMCASACLYVYLYGRDADRTAGAFIDMCCS